MATKPARPAPDVNDVIRSFEQELQGRGFMPGSIEADSDGFVRFDAPGDKPGKRNGYYKLRTGKYPVGWYGDWKQTQGFEWQWSDPNDPFTDEERRQIKRDHARLKAEAQVARETRQAEVAEDASRMWKAATPDVAGHPYLAKKGIEIPRGIRRYQAKDGMQLLAVPLYAFDMNGRPQLTNLQMIGPDGEKRFLRGGRVDGCFFSLKGDENAGVICFGEGFATGQVIWETTGLSTVVCLNAGNIVQVVKDFKRWRPMAQQLICGDDDAVAPPDWETRGGGRPWENAGVVKGEAAAKAVGARFIVPHFRKGPDRGRTDFDDLAREEGRDQVKLQVLGAFRSVSAEDQEDGATIVDFDQSKVQDESWRNDIPKTANGYPDGANVQGVALFIAHHRLLAGRLRYNELTREIELDGNGLQDYHVAEFRRIMHEDRFKARKSDVFDEMEAEARRNTFDPLLEYLAGLTWDGTKRLDTWLTSYAGVDDNPYVRAVGRKSLIGAVARAMLPGCKMDTMLILEGEQGTFKSTLFRYLFGDRFFIDNLPDFTSKDAFMQLQGAWCIEIQELSVMSKAEVGDVKQFLSRQSDKYRPPFGRATVQAMRRTVLNGTVNPEEGQGYLKDQTGGRRFWPVTTGFIDTGAVLRDRDQLWAEALKAYTQGEKWHIDDERIAELARAEQAARREVHPWEALLEPWLRGKSQCTIADVLVDVLKISADKQSPAVSRQVGACLRALGWRSKAMRTGEDKKTVKVFMSPGTLEEAGGLDFGRLAADLDDDVPF